MSWLLAVLLSAAARSGDRPHPYVLGVDDVISISVVRHPEYACSMPIPIGGKVSIPVLGEIVAAGRTIEDIDKELTERLADRLNHPEVAVTLVTPRMRMVAVIGDVKTPGNWPMKPEWRVTEAVAAAGGLMIPTEKSVCRLYRQGEPDREVRLSEILRDGEGATNFQLREGDTISVQSKKTVRVYVAGCVTLPGQYDLDEPATAVIALAKAGGQLTTSQPVTPSLSRAFVTRNGKKIPVNLSDVVQKGQVQKDVPLEDQDVLTIPPLQSKVAVFGEVGTPGWYELPDDRDVYLSDALAKSGGILRSGVMASIVILKRDGPKTTKLTYDFRKYLKNADAKSNPKLEPDDIVVINASKRTDFEKLLAPLLSIGVINTIGKL